MGWKDGVAGIGHERGRAVLCVGEALGRPRWELLSLNDTTRHAAFPAIHPGHIRAMPVFQGLWGLLALNEERWVDGHEFMCSGPSVGFNQHLGKHGRQEAQRNRGRDTPIQDSGAVCGRPPGRFDIRTRAAEDPELVCPRIHRSVQFIGTPVSERLAHGHRKRPYVGCRARPRYAESKLRGHEERCANLPRADHLGLSLGKPEIPQIEIWNRVAGMMIE